MNISWCRRILTDLHAAGVRDLVFCPGARNSPLVSVLAKTTGFELHSFFEERAAAFYALGLARQTGQPSAVITTSGTAVAELLPAVIEAHHTGIPLIVVTADRPRRLRGTGAPQAIDQTGMFTKFAGLEFDLESEEPFSLETWNRRSPVHLNICFDEPLLDEALEPLELPPRPALPSFAGHSPFAVSAGVEWSTLRLSKFLRGDGPLAVLVGTLETSRERDAVAAFLKRLGAPVYLESTSGLRERADLQELALLSGDQVLAWGLKRGMIDRVLRIGGIPTVRIWRDLDEPTSRIEVLSLSALPFAGLSRGELVCADIAATVAEVGALASQGASGLWIKDRAAAESLRRFLEDEPQSEPALVHALSRRLPAGALVYVGNSLPIREWDLAAAREIEHAVEANRGVNGIDGQVATFLGLARAGSENWAMIGDLTALYDLAAPWGLSLRPDVNAKIVVINNGGGQIFSRIFRTDLFINKHSLNFEPWARLWGLGYQLWRAVPEGELASGAEIIELVPDAESTRRFWERYDGLWK